MQTKERYYDIKAKTLKEKEFLLELEELCRKHHILICSDDISCYGSPYLWHVKDYDLKSFKYKGKVKDPGVTFLDIQDNTETN